MRRSPSSLRDAVIGRTCRQVIERLEPRRMLCLNTGKHFIQDDPQRWSVERGALENTRIEALVGQREHVASRGELDGGGAGGPANIVWANRGVTSGVNNDRFVDVFGTNAELARRVMDAAIVMWERVIGSFNYSDGSTDLNVTIKMDSAGTSRGASANVTQYLNGKPKAGRITMGRGGDLNGDGVGDGDGWFLDPTPMEHSEFTSFVYNVFYGGNSSSSPANNKIDFLSSALFELTHLVGLISKAAAPGKSLLEESPKVYQIIRSDRETLDNGEVSSLWVFQGTQSSRLLTERNGTDNHGFAVHTASYGTDSDIGVLGGRNYYNDVGLLEPMYGQNDIGNFQMAGGRYLVNESLRLLLDELYGYSTVPAARFGSMHANLHGNGDLYINVQGFNISNPVTTIDIVGANYVITVDPNYNENGVGAYRVNGQVAPWVHTFPTASVSRIVYNGSPDGSEGGDTLNIRALADDLSANLGAGNVRDVVNLGGDFIDGNITINSGAGNDLIFYDDSSNTSAPISYVLNGNVFSRSGNGTVTFNQANQEEFQLLASGGSNPIITQSVPDTLNVTINGSGGSDTLTVGSDACDGNIAFIGGTGTDLLRYADSAQVEPAQYALLPASFSRTNNGALSFSGVEQFDLLAGGGASLINVNNTTAFSGVTINGGAGDDSITLGAGDLDAHFGSALSIVGGNGFDTLLFNDTTDDPGNDTITINSASVTKPGLVFPINFSQTELHRFNASANGDTITINSGTAWQVNTNNGNDTIDVVGFAPGERVTIHGGVGADIVRANSDASGTAGVQFDVSQDLAQLRVGVGGSVRVPTGSGNTLIDTGSLLMDATNARLDLGNNRLIVRSNLLFNPSALMQAGYNGGLWDGANNPAASAIVAPFAQTTPQTDGLGWAVASLANITSFGGATVGDDDTLIGFTLAGDSNLNRTVDFNDLVSLARSFNQSGRGWWQGNFNYDANGLSNFNDLVILARNFNQTLTTPPAPIELGDVDSISDQSDRSLLG